MHDKYTIDRAETALVVVDVQERLAAAMETREKVVNNCRRLVEGAGILGIPVMVSEQYSKGLGPTESVIRGALVPWAPVEKITFSCCREKAFLNRFEELGRKTVVLAGMETHVCVLQTCLDLLGAGCRVYLARDAVSSRSKENWRTGLDMMAGAGAVISSTETVLFQLLERAGTDEFKAVSRLVK